MLADAARVITKKNGDTDTPGESGEIIHRKLTTKEDIKNYVKGII